jgi:hypothetical protein
VNVPDSGGKMPALPEEAALIKAIEQEMKSK